MSVAGRIACMRGCRGSVRRSLDHWERREGDEAMLHACNAVDKAAKKRCPELGVATGCRRIIRESLDIFGLMAAPALDFEHSRFPVTVQSDLPDGRPDIADVLYGVHRSSRGHEEDLPDGRWLPTDLAPRSCTSGGTGGSSSRRRRRSVCWRSPCSRPRTRAKPYPTVISSAGFSTCLSSAFGGAGKITSAKSSVPPTSLNRLLTSPSSGTTGRQFRKRGAGRIVLASD
jgi:hypothetical protein